MKLHHIGIVVKNIQESLGELTKFLNFESTTVPTLVGSQKVNVCFLKTNNVYIELIEPAEENSPILTFVAKGGGFHHICFEVDDIHKAIVELKENNITVIYNEPKVGAEGYLVTFIHPKSTGGVLVELAEKINN